ncbi:thiol-disulfide oxidoreductase DCC family protein [Flavobacterium sp. W21_SRS_FM6]|uniref:thiol-disulfide oxidoreductase DCC family protein n=1 Tax=Flavobacterium sp. W21_SRS_FM6 TaxID=3240268 RepID=UPI003F8F894A
MNTQLTVFYDGYCPLCMAEMNKLKQLDKHATLGFVDIQTPAFARDYPHLSWSALNARIHAQLPDGSLISGLDVTYLAWKLVGKGWIYAPLRWPVIRWFADKAYLVFAKHRYTLSFWLTGKRRSVAANDCEVCRPNKEERP